MYSNHQAVKMATLGAAKNVSPLIRFCRYAALATGLIYGSSRLSYLSKKEVKIQEHENAIRARRDARLAREKEFSSQAEMDSLGRECGIESKTG